jgi:hypothetical protein
MNIQSLYQKMMSPFAQTPSQPVAPSPAPPQEPQEQVQLGASPPPQSKELQWVYDIPNKLKELPWTEDDGKTHTKPSKDPSTLHSKMLVSDHDPLPPPAHAPESWLKDTGLPNAYYSSESKSLIFQDQATEYVPPAGKTFGELLNDISHITNQATEGKVGGAADHAATKALEDLSETIQADMAAAAKTQAEVKLQMMSGQMMMGALAGAVLGGFGSMGGLGMMGMGLGMAASAGLKSGPLSAFGAGINKAGLEAPPQKALTKAGADAELEAWIKAPVPGLHKKMLTLDEMPSGHQKAPTDEAEFAKWMSAPAPLFPADDPRNVPATAPVAEVEAPKGPTEMSLTQRANEVNSACTEKIRAMGESASFKVDKELLPLLDKLKMDPVDFFTARACWQGVSSKRRAVLEKVLDQFPDLPKDQKNVEAAMAAAEAKGAGITETDRFFLKYFFENRKEMKTLFRATLNLFEGDKISVYRGQSDSSKYAKDATKPLGCYSFNPQQSASWGSNLKRFQVKLNDVWSTSVVSQNDNRNEEEVTVYSRGGVRKGTPIPKGAMSEESAKFKEKLHPNQYMKVAKHYY